MTTTGRSVAQLLGNILIWGDRLARFIDGVSKQDFSTDELRQAGASKCVEAIGEACGELLKRYPDFAAAHASLELAQAYRARNRLSHGYDVIDWEILWDTATLYVPRLVAEVRRLAPADDAR
jgi:uncharacterized protein with HEPN domain